MYTLLQNYTLKIGILSKKTYICSKYNKQFEINTNDKNKSVLDRLETETNLSFPRIRQSSTDSVNYIGTRMYRSTKASPRHILWRSRLVYRLEKHTIDKIDLKTRKSLMFQCFQAIFYLYNSLPPLILILEAQNCIVTEQHYTISKFSVK